MSIDIKFDRYYTYDELTGYLKQYESNHSDLIALESIGKSHEGREVWVATVTNFSTGKPEDKPAMYVDANIHAGEVTGSIAALYLIDYLVSNYESDPLVKKLMDTYTFYILPRINPDGAELYLTTPTLLRSSVRPYPDYRKSEDPQGLHVEDIDGDGKILLMRVRDDLRGAWKVDTQDYRLMVERHPLDAEGPFYHVYTEGMVRDEFGNMVKEVESPFGTVATKYGLDLNRNFPSGFSPLTPGAGVFPLSEPETRNQVEFVSKRTNIAGVLLYHTTGGVLFRPHSTIPDHKFAKQDLCLYEAIGELGTEATGYPVVCCYGDVFSGVFDDWCFDQRGLLAFTPELWNAEARALGEDKVDFFKPITKEQRLSNERKMLQWNDRELAGEGFISWRKFQHPQLGEVEIGGWETKECRQNPPRSFLRGECHKLTRFALSYTAALPKACIDEVKVDKLAPGLYSVHALVANHGYLPTNITQQAVNQKAVRPDRVEIEPGPNMELVNSNHRVEVGYLEGYAPSQTVWGARYKSPDKQMARVKWTIKTPDAGGQVKITLNSERGGRHERVVELA